MIDWFIGGGKNSSKICTLRQSGKKTKQKEQNKLQPLCGMPMFSRIQRINKKTQIIGDRITRNQRSAIKKDPFGNWDKDGVINGLDCQPRNRKKHSFHPTEYEQNEYLRDSIRLYRDNPINDYLKNSQIREVEEREKFQSGQSLWHAGDQHPTATLKEQGRVYGFSDRKFAEGWAERHNKKHIFQFHTTDYDLDENQYMRQTPEGDELSDNEYVAYNVTKDEMVR